MWEFFIKNNKFAYLFLAALIGVGLYSLIAIPKESAPEVIVPVGIISTVLPGAPAADVESLVTNEIERGLSSVENVKKITSTSRESVSVITVEFDASANIDDSIQDLKDQVDIIKTDLPTDAEDPSVSEVNFVDQPIITFALAADLTPQEFTRLADSVEEEIEVLAGVSRVEKSGVRNREVTIIVDQSKLFLFDISLTDITNAIRNANVTFPIGQIENNGVSYNVAFEGDIEDPNQIANISITTRGGQSVYVRDIATVIDGLSPANSISRLSVEGAPSKSSISFDVYKQTGGDITAIARNINSRLAELQTSGEILESITSVTVLDAGKDIENDLIRLSSSGVQTVILVVLLLVLALGWREGLLAGAAIPLSFLFGFIGLYLSGNTINFLSLFSLILGIGILVDSAIVMVEGINRRMKDDPTIDKRAAAYAAISEFKAPLISGTLTTVSMFVGLFIVSGVIGQFIASIPFTLIFLLFASMFVALAIIPLLAADVMRRRSTTKFEQRQVAYARRLEDWYQSKLAFLLDDLGRQNTFLAAIITLLVFSLLLPVNLIAGCVAAPFIYFLSKRILRINVRRFREGAKVILLLLVTMIISVITVIGTQFLAPTISLVKVVFFEQGDVEFIIIEVENPEGTTKEVTDIAVRRVEELLYQRDDIESYTATVGSGSQFGAGGSGEKLANIFISLDEDRTETSTEIVEELRSELAVIRDVKVTVNQPSDGPPTGAALIIKFLGDDLTEITQFANETAELIRSIDNTTNIETSTNSNNTEFVLELDRNKTAALGLNPFTVSQIARTAVFGTDATSLTTLDEDIDVVVKLDIDQSGTRDPEATNITTIDDLTRINLPTINGLVPLSELVTVSLRESSSVINHEDKKRVVSVTADVTAEGNAREIQAEILRRVETELGVPAGVEISTGGGETDESNQAFVEMFLALVVGIGLMVGILTLQFNSYRAMAYVLSILPFSLIGIMFGLAITQNPLSFPSIMGFIALSGIVVNNSILLIDMMNTIRKNQPEKSLRTVVLETAGNRLRPILLTTITTVIGMVPLTYAGDLWSPLAYAVMFGLVFSVVITLVLIPIIYFRKPSKLAE